MKQIVFACCLLIFYLSEAALATEPVQNMALIPAGTYLPFFLQPSSKKGDKLEFHSEPISVKPFHMDRNLVTNQDYLHFVKQYPEWRRSKTPSLYVDSHYLENWPSDLKFNPKDRSKPVVHVSWFAVKAYCEAQNKSLPTTDQWEYALAAQGLNKEKIKDQILAWYSQPSSRELANVGTGKPNDFGLNDMVGVIWEWTLDFNSSFGGDDSGDDNAGIFCGNGSLGTRDASDYASFMRYSFRTSLKASYTTGNLGFRCAREGK